MWRYAIGEDMELKCCVKTSVGTRTYIERSFRKLFFEDLFLILICVCVGIYVHECWYRWNPDKGIGSLGGGVTGDCELPGMVTGNQTLQGISKEHLVL